MGGLHTWLHVRIISVQFSSVTQSCLTLCNPMNRSTPGLRVHHQLPEFTQTHVHRVGDAIQPSHPLSSSPPAPSPSQHQSFPMSQLFAWGGQSIGVSALAAVLPVNTQNWSPLEWTGWISLQSRGLSRGGSYKNCLHPGCHLGRLNQNIWGWEADTSVVLQFPGDCNGNKVWEALTCSLVTGVILDQNWWHRGAG